MKELKLSSAKKGRDADDVLTNRRKMGRSLHLFKASFSRQLTLEVEVAWEFTESAKQ
jgi:hypothetical protein